MFKLISAFVIVLSTLACEFVPPTAPTPVIATTEVRTPTQLNVSVIGPSGWYADRLVVDARVFDQRGATLGTLVRCETTTGYLELSQWDTTSRTGVWWYGATIGAKFTCHAVDTPSITATHQLVALDFEMPRGCCGGSNPAPTPKPPTPPVIPPGGGS